LFVSLPLVAKSVRINRLRLVLVASISLIIVTNATFLIRMLSPSGSLMVPALVFVFTFLPIFVVLLETISRSNQSLAVFRSLGAKKLTVTASILVTLVGAGLIGAIAGAGVGLLLAGAYSEISPVIALSSVGALPVIQGIEYVLLSFVAGLATAVFVGVRFSWNNLS
jgi:lipoprotein-releasing system permease protein